MDITDRKRVGIALQESEARFKGLADNSFDILNILDADATIRYQSHATQRILGYEAGARVGQSALDFMHPEDRTSIQTQFQQLVATPGGKILVEFRYQHADGSWVWLEASGQNFLHDPDLQGILINSRDITARKRAEAAQEESLARYADITARVLVGVYVFWIYADGRMAFEYVSDRWCEIHQLRREDVLANFAVANALVHPDDLEDFLACNHEAHREQKTFSWEGRFIIGGETHWLQIESTCEACANGDTRWFGVTQDVTRRKQMEAAILEERERLGNILAALETGLSLINPDMSIAWVNQKTHALFPGAEPVGQICHRFYEDRETPCENCGTQLAFQTGEVQTRERWNPLTGRWYTILSQPICDESGRALNVIEGVTDITERKQMEETLRESKTLLAKAEQMARLGSWAWDIENDVFTVSEGWQQVHGCDSRQLTSEMLLPIAHPDDRARIERAFAQALEGQQPYDIEHRIIRQDDGEVRIIQAYGEVIRDTHGNSIRMYGAAQDITERKRAAEALEEERAFLSTVLENIEEAIIICDADGRIIRFNEAARRLHGLPEHPIPPDKWAAYYDLYRADGSTLLPTEEIPLFRALQGEHVQDAEIVVASKHRRPRSLVCNGQALTDETGQKIGAVIAMHDITERKQAEAQVQRHLDELQAWNRVALHRETRLAELKQEVNALLARLAEPPRYQDSDQASGTTALDDATGAMSPSDITIQQTSLEKWQGITNLLAEVFQVPAALIMKVEPPDITVFVASHSEGNPYHPGERAALNTGLYCETVMSTRQKLLVPNALRDEHWDHNPDIPLGMISYLGFPVRWPDGAIFGTLCVLDTKENAYGPTYEQLLAQFRDIVETDLRTHWKSALQQQYATQMRRALLSMLEDARQAEAQLQEYADHLEQMVDEQVQQLEQERTKVIQMDKLASLGQLATSIAHELHQPLTAITFEADYLTTLANQTETAALDLAELMKVGQDIEGDVARCRRIIDHLRTFGRVAAEDTVPVDLNQPLEDSFILIGAQLRDHQVTVDLHLAEHLPYIQANPHKLEQVFLNLIANAEYALQEAAEQDGREKILTLSTRQEGDWVIAEVRDNGLGIPEDVQKRLFEPFFTTKPAGAGTGLGLSICHNIVTDIGGEITCHSTEGEGTTFTLRFPAGGV